jgi:hypothetical protein
VDALLKLGKRETTLADGRLQPRDDLFPIGVGHTQLPMIGDEFAAHARDSSRPRLAARVFVHQDQDTALPLNGEFKLR